MNTDEVINITRQKSISFRNSNKNSKNITISDQFTDAWWVTSSFEFLFIVEFLDLLKSVHIHEDDLGEILLLGYGNLME